MNKELFYEVVKEYMSSPYSDFNDKGELLDIDFEIFCDEFCVCHGMFNEVAEHIGTIIADECKKRLSLFDTILDNDVRVWAKDKYQEQFLTDKCSWGVNKKTIDETAADFIDNKEWVEVRDYDEERDEEFIYIFDFSKATFDPYRFLDCSTFYLYEECVDYAKELFS